MDTTDYSDKSSVEEIKNRFDKDVERFSDLDTGQLTVLDGALMMDLCTAAAKYVNPEARELLDIGCGAGNYTLKMLSQIPNMNCTLNDLSEPMLDRAKLRLAAKTTGKITLVQGDMRLLELKENQFDIILAAAVFHHLRDDEDWELVFGKMYRALKPGGSIWISDLITHDSPALNDLFRDRYSAYLETLGGAELKEKVWEYIGYEDSPRSINFQLDLMKKVGFKEVEVLHKNVLFGAFGGIK
jgi:tRNA (cmo5U34)-methyltransferase